MPSSRVTRLQAIWPLPAQRRRMGQLAARQEPCPPTCGRNEGRSSAILPISIDLSDRSSPAKAQLHRAIPKADPNLQVELTSEVEFHLKFGDFGARARRERVAVAIPESVPCATGEAGLTRRGKFLRKRIAQTSNQDCRSHGQMGSK